MDAVNNKRSAIADKSTATAAQLRRALELLRTNQRHTYEFRKLGISHPAARVKDLIAQGFVITASRITTVDAEGFEHRRVALYELVSEPKGGL
nr:helix-turn-helix domain-containing protein [Variovorax boronicumulans]